MPPSPRPSSAPNQNAWIAGFKARLAQDYPGLTLVEVRPCDDIADNARAETLKILEAHPHVNAIVGFCSPAVPGVARPFGRRGAPTSA